MKLFLISLLVVGITADRLENTYLPPNNANTAGGNGNFIEAPFSGNNYANYQDTPNAFNQEQPEPSREYIPSAKYGGPANKYNAPRNYGAPTQAPSTQYGAPKQTPSTQYGAPINRPETQYGAPARRPENQYGAAARQYSAPSSRPKTQYGAPAHRPESQYGAPASRPETKYGAPARRPENQYGAPERRPESQYGAPSSRPESQYGAPAQRPESQYGAPANRPETQYGAPIRRPEAQYGAPVNRLEFQYGAPETQYGAPASQPETQYGSPVSRPDAQYGAPENRPESQYGAPINPSAQYGAPSTTFNPSQKYAAPSRPTTKYGAPSASIQKFQGSKSVSKYDQQKAPTPSSTYGSPDNFAPAEAYGAPQEKSAESRASILRSNSENNGDGSYRFEYETENQISQQEVGELKNIGTENEASSVQGTYSYMGTDGIVYTVEYIADENGFRATGDHIPTTAAPTEAAGKSGYDYSRREGQKYKGRFNNQNQYQQGENRQYVAPNPTGFNQNNGYTY